MTQQAARVVRLELPAEAGLVRLARLTAAGLATELSYTIEEIEDLRVAIDELYFMLVDGLAPPVSATVSYTLLDGVLRVDGQVASGSAEALPIEALVKEILNVTTDEWSFDQGGGHRRFTLFKRRSQNPA